MATNYSQMQEYLFPLFAQEEELHYNVTAGIVLSDHSLVLQSITRESAGRYICMAFNVEGRASSNVVNLEVMCKYVFYFCGTPLSHEMKKKAILHHAKVCDKTRPYSAYLFPKDQHTSGVIVAFIFPRR